MGACLGLRCTTGEVFLSMMRMAITGSSPDVLELEEGVGDGALEGWIDSGGGVKMDEGSELIGDGGGVRSVGVCVGLGCSAIKRVNSESSKLPKGRACKNWAAA